MDAAVDRHDKLAPLSGVAKEVRVSGSRAHRNLPLAYLSLTMLWLMLDLPAANARDLISDVSPVARGLNKAASDLCHSLKMKCKKSPQPRANPAAPAAKAPKSREKETVKAQPPSGTPPIPVVKPQQAKEEDVQVTAPNLDAPIPRIRPNLEPDQTPPTRRPLEASIVPPKVNEPVLEKSPPKPASLEPTAPVPGDAGDCQRSLRASNVQFDIVPASFGNPACPIDDPVRLHSVETPSGIVSFPEGPVFNCRFARQFALWVSDTGSAVVLAKMGKGLVKVATGPGYDCRHRNGDSSGKMSEHATGDAVDITTITLVGGTTLQMADAIDPAAPTFAVLSALRTTACGYFTTVLGPGANEAHKEHYHFDLGVHGKSGNYRICQ